MLSEAVHPEGRMTEPTAPIGPRKPGEIMEAIAYHGTIAGSIQDGQQLGNRFDKGRGVC